MKMGVTTKPVTSPSWSSDRSGFTLIEMLVVIAVISIMLSFLVLGVSNSIAISKQEATKALIKKLESGLQAYQSDFHAVPERSDMPVWIPPPSNSPLFEKYDGSLLHALLGTEIMYYASVDPATGRAQFARKGPYIELEPEEVKNGNVDDPKEPIIDAWKNEIRTRFEDPKNHKGTSCGSKDNRDWVDIWSEGGEIETDTPYDGCGEDDITNFGSTGS